MVLVSTGIAAWAWRSPPGIPVIVVVISGRRGRLSFSVCTLARNRQISATAWCAWSDTGCGDGRNTSAPEIWVWGKGSADRGQVNRKVIMPYVVLAGAALGRQDILDDALGINSIVVGQPFWTEARHVGVNTLWADPFNEGSDQSRRNRTAFPQDVGFSWAKASELGWSFLQRYVTVSSLGIITEVLAIMLLKNLPGGKIGEEWLRAFGPATVDNPRASILDWCDTIYAYNNGGFVDARPMPGWLKDLYLHCRNSVVTQPWPKRTPLHNLMGSKLGQIAAVEGSVGYDFTGRDLSFPGHPDTRRDLRVSIGSVQFVEHLDVGVSGTILGMPRMPISVQERRLNAFGAGVWSDNYRYSGSVDALRAVVTPTGLLPAPPQHSPCSQSCSTNRSRRGKARITRRLPSHPLCRPTYGMRGRGFWVRTPILRQP